MRSVAAVCVAACLARLGGAVQCRDESGSAVDWWAMFKFPDGTAAAFVKAGKVTDLQRNADLADANNPLHQCVSQVPAVHRFCAWCAWRPGWGPHRTSLRSEIQFR